MLINILEESDFVSEAEAMPLGLTKQEKRALSVLALVLLLCLVGVILF